MKKWIRKRFIYAKIWWCEYNLALLDKYLQHAYKEQERYSIERAYALIDLELS